MDKRYSRLDGPRSPASPPPSPTLSISSSSKASQWHTLKAAVAGLVAGSVVFWGIPALHRHVTPLPPDNSHVPDTNDNVCLSPACVHAASEILYNLSPDYKDLDPCDNFEELVCGGWGERHDLRPDQGDAFTGTIMAENSQLLLRNILESPYRRLPKDMGFGDVDDQNFDKLKTAYEACLDEEAVAKAGLKPLQDILDSAGSLWQADSSKEDSILKAELYLAQFGIHPLVEIGTGPDDRDPDTVVVSVFPPDSWGLPSKERYEDDDLVEDYRGYANAVLRQIFPDIDQGLFSLAIDFEKKLAAASPPTEERENVAITYNPMTISEASQLAPEIGLQNFIAQSSPSDVKVERVIVAFPDYIESLSKIIQHTSTDVLQIYFAWKTVQSFAFNVEADEVKPWKRFLNKLQGKDPESTPLRWRRCISHVDKTLSWLLSRFFVEKAFSAEAKNFGDTIIEDIKDEFIKKLKATEWMDDVTTDRAITKVHNIMQKIGYPTESPDITNAQELWTYYTNVTANRDDFFGNGVSARAFSYRRGWDALGKPVDRNEWGMSVPTVNAYYNPPGNEIVFPAGLMQFPVFDVEVPAYMAYGAFGSVAGHELSHAFDSLGRNYDENGNLTQWWTEATIKAFTERTECFIDQYAKYTVEGPDGKPLHVNGRLTLGENIADAGGLSAAFQAWKDHASNNRNQHLPGLDHFTQEQLFFVSYSNWWCGKSRKSAAISKIYTDPHAPKWARILGTMANSREFRESFQCKLKDPTCEIW